MNISGSLCPPIDQELSVQGKPSLSIEKNIRLLITRCNTSDPTCANDTLFSMIESAAKVFSFAVPMLATNVNTKSVNYKELYINEENIFHLTSQMGFIAYVLIQHDTIENDISLMPYEDI